MLKKFTIDRSKWLIPETSEEDSCLLASDGKMCCLGQYGQQSGIKKSKLFDVKTPAALVYDQTSTNTKRKYKALFKGLVQDSDGEPTPECKTLMYINDISVGGGYTRYYKNGGGRYFKIRSQQHKEKLIAEEFAKIGVEVIFVGELDYLPK